MKKHFLFVIVMCVVMTSMSIAQVPRYLSHQGFLTRADGSPFDTTIAMAFKLYNDSTGGSAVWEETHPSVTVTQGVFNATLGRGTVFTIPFDKQYWLEVIAGAQTLAPRRRLVATAYSLGPWSTTGNDVYYNFGNVGIGTTSPTSKLEINGDTKISGNAELSIIRDAEYLSVKQNTASASQYQAWYTSTNLRRGYLGYPSTSSNFFEINNETGGNIGINGGNVGIGTTSPVGKLHLYGSGTTVEQRIENGTASSTGLRIRTNGADVGFLGTGDYVSSGGSNSDFGLQSVGNLIFASSGGGNERMRITTAGNIGIGTASPGYKLDVRSTTPLSIAVYGKMTAASGSPHFAGQFENTSTAGTSYGVAGYATGAGTTNVAVYGSATGATNNYAAIFENGNVGIGTTAPQTYLHIKGNNITNRQTMSLEATDIVGLTLYNGPSTEVGALYYAIAGNVLNLMAFPVSSEISIVAGNAEAIRIKANGNVGIGTTSPSTILSVVQTSATDPIADAWTTYSSRRWKKNIKSLESSLEKVEQLQGVSFDWKADNKHDIGLIAEDVGKVVPEVVAYEENGKDAKSVDYARLVVLLIEGMKEQQKEIKEQSQQIKELKERMAKMENGMESKGIGEMRK